MLTPQYRAASALSTLLSLMNFSSLRESLHSLSRSNGALIATIVLVSLGQIGLWLVFPAIDNENHLLEWLQALFLLLACVVHGQKAWTEPDRDSLRFLIHAGLSALMFGFLLRELEIREMGEAYAWTVLEKTLRLLELLVLLRLLVFFAPRARVVFANVRAIFGMRVTLITLVGGLFMVAGWPFDKKVIHSLPEIYSELLEEVFELDGYLLLFLAALADTSAAARIKLRRPKAR